MQSKKSLYEMVLGLIVVLKQASCQYPMAHLQRKEFTRSVSCYGLMSVDEGVPEMLAFL